MAATFPPPEPTTADPAPPRRRRRVLPLAVLGVALVLVAGAAVFILTGDDGDGDGDTSSTTWDGVATADARNGAITILDRRGDALRTIETGVDAPRFLQVSPRVIAATDGDGGVALADVTTGEVTDVELPEGLEDVRPIPSNRSVPVLVAGTPNFGPAAFVATDGTVLDVADAAGWDEPFVNPASAFATPDGRRLAITNVRDDIESVVVSFEESFEPVVVAGTTIAIDEGSVTTYLAGPDGDQLETFDLDGESLGSVEVEDLRAVLDGQDGTLLTVGMDGTVTRVDVRSGDSERIDRIDLGDERLTRSVSAPGPDGAIVLVGPSGDGDDAHDIAHIVRADGTILDPIELAGEVSGLEVGRGADACVAVGAGDQVAIVRLADGSTLASHDARNGPTIVGSDDMCAVIPFDDAMGTVLSAEGATTLQSGDERIAALSSDGAHVVVSNVSDRTAALRPLTAIDGGDGAVDLGEVVGQAFFVDT